MCVHICINYTLYLLQNDLSNNDTCKTAQLAT